MGSVSTNNLDTVITRYERQLLLDALGVELYNGLETAMGDLESAAQKWKDLVNGSDYAVDGESYRWDGLKGNAKDGLLAHYIYCMYLRQDEIDYSTTGMKRNAVENAVRASYTEKYVTAWSNFINMYQGENTVRRSLRQFLEDRESDFPIGAFKCYGNVNRFGI
ncbi:hypothetical protein J0X14_14245 [Muricauda sp. CAU 1633]|uniref:hypothetical protein n=1 Tax=Allomuricauda sp. CAU 1633 TaxID=2816036 RepID=UPI001A903AD5|nr:hypothetical protein [Muricauda sp. CAU 1633]MBO0323465.1 hypothetical protein [Muricauda sp. CAU 1633]